MTAVHCIVQSACVYTDISIAIMLNQTLILNLNIEVGLMIQKYVHFKYWLNKGPTIRDDQ